MCYCVATNALWQKGTRIWGELGAYFESSGVEDDASDGSDENCDEIEHTCTSEDENEVEREDEDDTAPNEQNMMNINEPTEADLLGKDGEVWLLELPQAIKRSSWCA